MPLIIFLIALLLLPSTALSMASGTYTVREVIDGDTIVLLNGEKVRYIGVDTPEVNEPFYLEARVRNMVLVLGKPVRVSVCGMEQRDKYGRVLAWVYSDGALVNETLLREGLGRALMIPPCGLVTARQFELAESEARSRKLGVWGPAAQAGVPTIRSDEAWLHIGRMVKLKGVVQDVIHFGNSWYLDFGGPDAFRAVVLPRALPEFERRGIDLHAFKGREVAITGIITEYRGRSEILIVSPSRLE